MQAQELRDKSVVRVNSAQDVYQILTDREALEMVLDQGLEEKYKKYKSTIIGFFTNIKDKININDLTVYPSSTSISTTS